MNYRWEIKNYHEACNNMLIAFATRHDMSLDPDPWVGGEPGGIAAVGDFFVGMQDIYYDVLAEPDPSEFFKFHDYELRLAALDIESKLNYESWCKGAPRYSDEALDRIEKTKKELEEIIIEETNKNITIANDIQRI